MDFLNKLTHNDEQPSGHTMSSANSVARPHDTDSIKRDHQGDLMGALTDAIAGKPHHEAPPPPPPAPAHHGGLLGALSGAIGGKHTPPPPPPAPEHHGLVGALSDALGKRHSDGVARPHDTDTIKPHSGGLMGSINNALGGGAAGEKKEDHLDKGIDWVQEHILGQGSQSNESALEQAKDKQIADAIRHTFKNTTGHDFPSKTKS